MAARPILTLIPAVVGPTACGKTALAIALAHRLSAEIVSCDSMQIYRGMDIGTAKPDASERAAVPHHLIDFLPPGKAYSASDYAEDAYAAVGEILSRHKLPLFCGGTGLYLDAARRGATDEQIPGATEIRARLQKEAEAPDGPESLHARLSELDPAAAAATHKNNTRRVIRALEIYLCTGITKTEWDKKSKERPPALRLLPFGIRMPREILCARIDARVGRMFDGGLVAECARLYEAGLLAPGSTAAQAIGYKEILPYLRGECTQEEAKEALCLATRQYAKRQMTWFSRDASVIWLSGEQDTEALADEAAALYRHAAQKQEFN